ncbi:glycosyltransferase [Croceivirga sp. JEA036]|uniref:glycosyltransferase n=1 Tax=Croceivirga sp. JEA036 TaxID=2721162 RepID=UPI00143C615B|nr:glycosyltransferase [Croceivirga sp. JEA036]NJB35617.1 glycosyltransferase [Croceivirga sp. JEA036]
MEKILIVGYVWPEPNTTAAGERMLQLLELFLSHNFEVHFATSAVKTEYSTNLEALGVHCQAITLNSDTFDSYLQRLNPDVVVFDRFMLEEQFGWRVREQCPNALRILNTEDLHSLREARQIAHKKKHPFKLQDWYTHPKTQREIGSIYRCDLTLLVSDYEMQLLQQEIGIQPDYLLQLPFLIRPQTQVTPTFETRKDVVTFGNGKHGPNVDSITYLKEEIWPLLRQKLPKNTKLHVYGAYLPQRVQEWHNPKEGFLVHGWVKDLKDKVQQARLVVAPLRFGAGIKGKLSLAMECGAPSITTKIGVEGMGDPKNWPGSIGNTTQEFVDEVIRFYQDEKLWQEAQEKGFQFLKNHFDKAKQSQKFLNTYHNIQENIVSHRAKNIIGNLLHSNSLNATKYMGKWITEKNKGNR